MSLSYEQQRLQNIKDNEALLLSLGLSIPSPPRPPKPKVLKPKTTPLKRTMSTRSDYSESPTPTNAVMTRRSARASTSTPINYKQGLPRNPRASLPPMSARSVFIVDDDVSDGRLKREGTLRYSQSLVPRLHNPKRFGSIPGIPVGKWYATRAEASQDSIHAPMVAGISGNSEAGAWSIALSGGYADDVDMGYAFTFSGAGGRDLKGTKNAPKNLRTAPQTMHQSFDNPLNAALKRSAETQMPVRVLRGFKGTTIYAPEAGYRYDGLYAVERAWMAKGMTKGLLVCKYAFKRLPGQPPIPTKGDPRPVVGADKAQQVMTLSSVASSTDLVTPSTLLEDLEAHTDSRPDVSLGFPEATTRSTQTPRDDGGLLGELVDTRRDTRKRRATIESLQGALAMKSSTCHSGLPRKRRRLVMYVEL